MQPVYFVGVYIKMDQKILIIVGMTGIALYLVYSRREKLKSKDPSFREGYVAGFFTPGPFTIIAVAGGVYYFS